MIDFISNSVSQVFANDVLIAGARCYENGRCVHCGDFVNSGAGSLFAGGAILIILFMLFWLALCIAGFVFWIMMLIHAASKPIENKTVWIVVLALTGVIGAIVYYFVEKRKFDRAHHSPQTTPAQPTN